LNILSNAGNWAKYYIQQFNTDKKIFPTIRNGDKSKDNSEDIFPKLENVSNPSTQVNALLNISNINNSNKSYEKIMNDNHDNNDSIEVTIDGKILC
jgi:hypothetical protein